MVPAPFLLQQLAHFVDPGAHQLEIQGRRQALPTGADGCPPAREKKRGEELLWDDRVERPAIDTSPVLRPTVARKADKRQPRNIQANAGINSWLSCALRTALGLRQRSASSRSPRCPPQMPCRTQKLLLGLPQRFPYSSPSLARFVDQEAILSTGSPRKQAILTCISRKIQIRCPKVQSTHPLIGEGP